MQQSETTTEKNSQHSLIKIICMTQGALEERTFMNQIRILTSEDKDHEIGPIWMYDSSYERSWGIEHR